MDIDPANRRSMRSGWRGSDAGVMRGSGSRPPELLRSNRFQAVDARSPQTHGLPMGAFVHRTLAASTRTDGGWEPREGERNATGWVVSPIFVEISFCIYTFDIWMQRNRPTIPFERYADDVICHCRSEEQARTLRASLETRFAECGLTLHPDKAKVVYCNERSWWRRRGRGVDVRIASACFLCFV